MNELYEFYEKIGEGAFSDVYRCKFLVTDEIIAVKITKAQKKSELLISLVKQEAELLNQLDHPNIVKAEHLIQINDQLYMGMELIKCGSLSRLIEKKAKEH